MRAYKTDHVISLKFVVIYCWQLAFRRGIRPPRETEKEVNLYREVNRAHNYIVVLWRN